MAEKVDQMDPDEKIVEIAIERLRASIISQYNSCRIDENTRERCNYCNRQ